MITRIPARLASRDGVRDFGPGWVVQPDQSREGQVAFQLGGVVAVGHRPIRQRQDPQAVVGHRALGLEKPVAPSCVTGSTPSSSCTWLHSGSTDSSAPLV